MLGEVRIRVQGLGLGQTERMLLETAVTNAIMQVRS